MRTHYVLLLLCLLALSFSACKKSSPGTSTQAQAGPLAITLNTTPLKVDQPATVRVRVTSGGQPVENAVVHATLTMATMDMGETELDFAPRGNGEYETTQARFSMSGPWKFLFNMKHGDRSDTTQVTVEVP